jgi:hypothetical protein
LGGAAINLSCTSLHALYGRFFWMVHVTIVILLRCILHLCILLATAGSDAAIIPVIMMVPFDSSRQELSNGGHIVICSNFDLFVENPAAASDLQVVGHFLDPFFAELNGKSCSYDAA